MTSNTHTRADGSTYNPTDGLAMYTASPLTRSAQRSHRAPDMRAALVAFLTILNGGSPDSAPDANNVSALDILDGRKDA